MTKVQRMVEFLRALLAETGAAAVLELHRYRADSVMGLDGDEHLTAQAKFFARGARLREVIQFLNTEEAPKSGVVDTYVFSQKGRRAVLRGKEERGGGRRNATRGKKV